MFHNSVCEHNVGDIGPMKKYVGEAKDLYVLLYTIPPNLVKQLSYCTSRECDMCMIMSTTSNLYCLRGIFFS